MPLLQNVDLTPLTPLQLLELTEYCFWETLAGDAQAESLFRAIEAEHGSRGSTAHFREALLGVEQVVLAALEGIKRSEPFRSAPKRRKLLEIIVLHTLSTREPIKQDSLGIELYDRVNFDRAAVATEVRHLREKLREYYDGPGLGDRIRVQIPKERYIAVIRRMTASEPPEFLDAGEPRSEIQITALNGMPGVSVFPAFSPAGDQLVFSSNAAAGGYRFDLFVQALSATTPSQISSSNGAADISPAWSPDGEQVAFLRLRLGGSDVMVRSMMAASPAAARTIAAVFPIRYEIIGRHLAWSPDGRTLAIGNKGSSDQPFAIFLVALETGEMRQLTYPAEGIVGDGDPAFSTDGRALAFVRTEAVGIKDVFVLELGTDRLVRLTSDHTHVHGIAWRPDRKSIVFSSARAGVPALWQIDLQGGAPERLAGVGEPAFYPAASPDGRRIAYTNLVMSSSIWESPGPNANDDGTRLKRLIHSTRNDVNPDFSPDGSRIAFASDRSGAFEIWMCERDGANPSKITSFQSPAGAGTPRWSPDGQRIAFDCRADGNGQIYVVTLTTGKPRRLTRGNAEHVAPSWSSDGHSIYFSSNRTGRHQVWKMAYEGGDATQLTRGGGFGPRESPDGCFVYYAKSRTAPGLWRTPAAGGGEELLLETLKPMFWGLWVVTPAGIYFLDSTADGPPPCSLKFFDLRTGSISELAVLPGIRVVHYQGLAISPDHKRVLYSQLDESAGEIMVAKLL